MTEQNILDLIQLGNIAKIMTINYMIKQFYDTFITQYYRFVLNTKKGGKIYYNTTNETGSLLRKTKKQ